MSARRVRSVDPLIAAALVGLSGLPTVATHQRPIDERPFIASIQRDPKSWGKRKPSRRERRAQNARKSSI